VFLQQRCQLLQPRQTVFISKRDACTHFACKYSNRLLVGQIDGTGAPDVVEHIHIMATR
jgi:hypothetical protein